MRVSLFITCLVDQMFPDVGEAMVVTLRRLGVTVGFNDAQTCCGQVAFNTGYRPEARSMAEHFIKVFESDPADFIVAPSGSCTAMVRNFYGELFHGPDDGEWRDRIARVRSRLREFSEFIVNDLGVEDVGASFPRRRFLKTASAAVVGGAVLGSLPLDSIASKHQAITLLQ